MQTDLGKNAQQTRGDVQASSTGFVILAAVFAAVGGLLFGYDTAAISGAVIFIKQQFSLSTFPEELVVGMVLVGAALAALGGGRLSDRLGRRTTLILTSLIFILGALICAFADSLQTLLVGRTIAGLGIERGRAMVRPFWPRGSSRVDCRHRTGRFSADRRN